MKPIVASLTLIVAVNSYHLLAQLPKSAADEENKDPVKGKEEFKGEVKGKEEIKVAGEKKEENKVAGEKKEEFKGTVDEK